MESVLVGGGWGGGGGGGGGADREIIYNLCLILKTLV